MPNYNVLCCDYHFLQVVLKVQIEPKLILYIEEVAVTGFPGGSVLLKNPHADAGDTALILNTAIHSSILAGKIPWIVKPHGLQSLGLQRVGYY